MHLKEICPVCKAKKTKYLFAVKLGQLIECNNCHLIYYTPRPTPKQLENFYNSENYRNDFSDSLMSGTKFATNRYLNFESKLKKYAPHILTRSPRSLLDVGCGTGDFLQVAQQYNWQVSGTEISNKAAHSINCKLGGDYVQTGNLFSTKFEKSGFDVITIFHVIEHVLDPVSLLEKIHVLLKPRGVIFVETPNISGLGAKLQKSRWSQIIPPEHIVYFKPQSLQFIFRKTGFLDNQVFTCRPQIIESLHGRAFLLKAGLRFLYEIAPFLNLGATLQGIGIKN